MKERKGKWKEKTKTIGYIRFAFAMYINNSSIMTRTPMVYNKKKKKKK